MAVLGPQADGFLKRYVLKWDELQQLATLAAEYMGEALQPRNYDIQVIAGRAKAPEAARQKVLSKGYGHPALQLTDQVGVRIIASFGTDVDFIVDDLRRFVDIDEARSPDKRSALGLREFGYRSVHLVGKVRSEHLEMRFERLADLRLEIQVRSILEHAWAEIEHDVVYKAGVDLPAEIRRRFSAIAGTLEILETEFENLRRKRSELIELHAASAAAGQGFDEPLDSARLLGFLEVLRPEGLSWRQSIDAGTPFPPRIEATCVQALRRAGIGTGGALKDWLDSGQFRSAVAAYASSIGDVPSELSHLAVVILAVASCDFEVGMAFLPELAGNPAVREAVGGD